MNAQQRLALRAAQVLHEAFSCRAAHGRYLALPDAAWASCRRLVHLIDKAKLRGWAGAQQKLEQHLIRSDAECVDELVQVRQRLEDGHGASDVASERDIFADLLALNTEFEAVQIDIRETTIAVEMDRIVLQGIDLGPFRIVLDWSNLSHHWPYEVIAQDPNPAASSADTTHPHVRDNHLCEGDGRAAIRSALRQGRVLDFFILVRQVLESYSPDNAYVKLLDWDGRDCADCGRTVNDNDCVTCERCGTEICSDCATSCTNCSEYFCSSHIASCPSCDDPYCKRCLAACQACGGKFCKECLDDEKCPTCRGRDEDVCEYQDGPDEGDELDAVDATDANDTTDSDASFHPLRLGQAAVLA